jgi:hypothetical protein
VTSHWTIPTRHAGTPRSAARTAPSGSST